MEITARYLHYIDFDLDNAVKNFEDPFLTKKKLVKENSQRYLKHLNTLCRPLSIKNYGPAEI